MTTLTLTDPPCRVTILRNKRARRFILRLDPGGDGAILTQPPGVGTAESRVFLDRHADWLRSALARQPTRVPVRPGSEVMIGGAPVRVICREGPRRAPVLVDGEMVLQGRGAAGPRVATWLKLRARDLLEPAARHYARKVGGRIERISLRDTRSRWGSCSTSGTLSFSWRLAMAPREVAEYVAAHEAAHLAEMNHSPRYWALVERIYPGWQRQRDWLKRHGRGLHRFDFSADG